MPRRPVRAALALTLACLLGAACSNGAEERRPAAGVASPGLSPGSRPTPPPPAELPRGGRSLLPEYRLVGYAGAPGSTAFGRLGVGDLDARVRELEKRAKPYAAGRKVMPVLELIATVVQGAPGRDGKWRNRQPESVVKEYLAAARRHDALLLLNVQPGHEDFIAEVRHYEKWLREPDVGLALDPEWSMGPGQVPMRQFGHMTGAELNAVTRYVSGVVRRHDLPEKVVVVHELAPRVLRDESRIRAVAGVVIVKSVDGIGSRGMKEETWRRLTREMPGVLHAGFKLFYEEDTRHGPLMTPTQVLALKPRPEYVLYE